mmetsp:Transcript_11063/g.25675  ORF Transcript_11063/g.25675 Transcript_11063/m.25675 type:complete len:87 (-) Transcript_11063:498-758(-)
MLCDLAPRFAKDGGAFDLYAEWRAVIKVERLDDKKSQKVECTVCPWQGFGMGCKTGAAGDADQATKDPQPPRSRRTFLTLCVCFVR